jgi:hypothetical protein
VDFAELRRLVDEREELLCRELGEASLGERERLEAAIQRVESLAEAVGRCKDIATAAVQLPLPLSLQLHSSASLSPTAAEEADTSAVVASNADLMPAMDNFSVGIPVTSGFTMIPVQGLAVPEMPP